MAMPARPQPGLRARRSVSDKLKHLHISRPAGVSSASSSHVMSAADAEARETVKESLQRPSLRPFTSPPSINYDRRSSTPSVYSEAAVVQSPVQQSFAIHYQQPDYKAHLATLSQRPPVQLQYPHQQQYQQHLTNQQNLHSLSSGSPLSPLHHTYHFQQATHASYLLHQQQLQLQQQNFHQQQLQLQQQHPYSATSHISHHSSQGVHPLLQSHQHYTAITSVAPVHISQSAPRNSFLENGYIMNDLSVEMHDTHAVLPFTIPKSSRVAPVVVPGIVPPKNSEWQDYLLQLAHAKYSESDFASALSILQTLFLVAPSHIPTLLLLGCTCYSLGLYPLSMFYNKLILGTDANFAEAYSNLGTTYRALGKEEQAERCYRRAVEIRPEYWDGARNLVSILCSKGQWHNALEVYERAEQRITHLETLNINNGDETSATGQSNNQYITINKVWPPEHKRDLYHAKGNMRFALMDVEGAKQDYIKAVRYMNIDLEAFVHDFVVSAARLAGIHLASNQMQSQATLLRPGVLLVPPQQAIGLVSSVLSQLTGTGITTIATTTTGSTTMSPTNATIVQSLAKLFQDTQSLTVALPLYFLSLYLHLNPHTCNLLGILFTTISCPAIATQYYNFGLHIDPNHVHLYTNLGSVLKDQGHIMEAVQMYERAVRLNPDFEIALSNLANAMKDLGRVDEACVLYKRALTINPYFIDAFCNYVNTLNFICDWHDRDANFIRIRELVDKQTPSTIVVTTTPTFSPVDGTRPSLGIASSAYTSSSVEDTSSSTLAWCEMLSMPRGELTPTDVQIRAEQIRIVQLQPAPSVPTVLPFHTFTYPLSPRQIRLISCRNAARIVHNVLSSSWYPSRGFRAPSAPYPFAHVPSKISSTPASSEMAMTHNSTAATAGPAPRLRVGYVSSDWGNHPLSHLTQSIYGFHDRTQYEIFCYALTPSDGTVYRLKIEREVEHFFDISGWSVAQICERINTVDQIHVLINLNGYTKGACNEIFGARCAPVQLSYMGFAGTIGALGWIDYFITDPVVCPPETVFPQWPLRMTDVEQHDERYVYTEKMIYMPYTYFVNDHKQNFRDDVVVVATLTANSTHSPLSPFSMASSTHSIAAYQQYVHPYAVAAAAGAPTNTFLSLHTSTPTNTISVTSAKVSSEDASLKSGLHTVALGKSNLSDDTRWEIEEETRWRLRRELFHGLADDIVIFANFNQLYKIDPEIFRVWLRILARVPKSMLWLLKFPAAGEQHLKRFAEEVAGPEVASRIVFTDVACKQVHISRGRIADLFLDTPECNAHTTACDILWSGTPIITYPRHTYKLCSRVAASVALATGYGNEMIVRSEQEYADRAVEYANTMRLEWTTAVMTVPPSGSLGELLISTSHHNDETTMTNGTRGDTMMTSTCTTTQSILSQPPAVSTGLGKNFNYAISSPMSMSNSQYLQHHQFRKRLTTTGPLYDLKRQLFLTREQSNLFDTQKWVRHFESGIRMAWEAWLRNECGKTCLWVQDEEVDDA